MIKFRNLLLASVVMFGLPMAAAQAGGAHGGQGADVYGGLLADFSMANDTIFDTYSGSQFWSPESSTLMGIGGVIGARMYQGSLFYGVEGDVNANLSNHVNNNGFADIDRDFGNAHMRLLVGQEIGDVSLFAAGGLAGTSLEFIDTRSVLRTSTALGWSLGVGADVAVNDKMSLRVEALHDQYDNVHFDDSNVSSGYNAKWSENTVRVGAIFKF